MLGFTVFGASTVAGGRCARGIALAVAFGSGCASPSSPAPKPSGDDSGALRPDTGEPVVRPVVAAASQSMVAADGLLLAVHPDEGVLSRLDPATGEVEALQVGAFPTRIAAFGGNWVVSLRGERALAVVRATGPLEVLSRAPVGAEPVGLVASPDGERLYVSLYGADEVLELNQDLDVTRRFVVPGRPSWLALHPGGRWLAVGAQLGGIVSLVDLEAAQPAAEPLPVPALPIVFDGRERTLSRRVTGDLAWSPDGLQLAAPMLFVDNTAVPKHTAEEAMELDPAYRYEAIGLGMSPNNPAVALWSVDAAGHVDPDSLRLLNAVGRSSVGVGGVPQVVRSFLSSVIFSPDGQLVVASMEAADVVVALRADAGAPAEAEGGLLRPPGAWFSSGGAGAKGLAFLDENDLWVHNFIDGTAAPLPLAEARAGLDTGAAAAMGSGLAGPPTALLIPPYDSLLDPQVALGRRLFNSGVTPTITTPLSGVSCGTCHFESRNDGLGWMEVDGVFRQTLSLAGPISETAPFTWNNDVATVADEVQITSQARLGGRGAGPAEFEAVAAYVEQTPDIDHAHRGDRSAAAVRGQALFEDPQVGCAGCHFGPRFTDRQAHDMYGLLAVDTPSLIGLEATPPYLHDGSEPTLGPLLRRLRAGGMGDVSGLSDADLDDLEAYLRIL